MMRHVESEDNEAGVISGSGSDPNITKNGLLQAAEAAKVYCLLDDKPDRIIVSGLRRTHQTAEAVVGHKDYIVEPGINERYLGDGDGITPVSVQKQLRELPNEESKQAHSERVLVSINSHINSSEGVPMFIAHAGTIRRVFEACGFQDEVPVGNSKLYKFCPIGTSWKIFELGMEQNELKKKDITPNTRSGWTKGAT